MLLIGGGGNIRLRMEDGRPKFAQGNFLPRARGEFIRNGILPVILDNPSDQQRRDERRLSREPRALHRHPCGARRAVQALSRTCRYSSSAPAAAPCRWLTSRAGCRPTFRARCSPRRCSIPAAASAPARCSPGSTGRRSSRRLLFVHHEDDGCGATPYREAARVTRYPLVALITVHGGKPPESGPCEPRSNHGFFGREAQTVDAIAAWMLKKTVSERYPVSVLRRHHLPVVVPAVPGAAADRAPDPAVVRRQRGGVDHLHAVLPGAAARRLCLCALPHPAVQQARRGRDPHRAARRRGGDAADRAERCLEAARHRGTGHPHPAAARRQRRPAVLPAGVDQPAAAGLVRARAARARTRTACSRSRTSPRSSR